MSIDPIALSIVLACAFGWVGLDLLRKMLTAHGGPLQMTLLLVGAQIPLFLGWAAIDGRWGIDAGYWLPGLGCIAVNLAANLTYMQSVKQSPMSATLPLLSLTPVFTTLVAVPLLGELPRATQGVGILIVVFGALALNADPATGGVSGLWRGFVQESGAFWMVVTALLWSISTPLDKLAIRHASAGMHALLMVTGIVVGLIAILAVQGRLGDLPGIARRSSRVLVASAVVSGIALFFQLLAIQTVWVGLVETVKRGIGAAMALILGRLIFGEALSGRRMAAVGLMIVGVWLVLM